MIDALNFRIRISAILAVTTVRGSWLATFIRYRKSWFSIIVKSQERNLDTPVVIRRNCNKASGRTRPVCTRPCMCMSVCEQVSDSSSTKIIPSPSKTAELLSSITEVLYKLMPVTRDGDLLVENAADVSLAASVYTMVHTPIPSILSPPTLVAVLMVITP